jgi:toxin FitB
LTHLLDQYQDDIFHVNVEIVERWGRLSAQTSMPVIDSQIAASALEYRLTVATRNIRDFVPTEVPVVNPF